MSSISAATISSSSGVNERASASMANMSLKHELRRFRQDELTDCKYIGSGGFGYVNRWKLVNSPTIYVAEKQIVKGYTTDNECVRGLYREVEILGQTDHPRVVKLLGILEVDHQFSLIIEYMEHGSCYDFFTKRVPLNVQHFQKWPLKFRISIQVCDAMIYLHKKGPKKILHLDLKSRNVLLDGNLNVKLCDFGLAQIKNLTSRITQTTGASKDGSTVTGGTISHIAPEHLRDVNRPATTKSDVYSFGIFLWELTTEQDPYKHALPQVFKEQIIKGGRPDMTMIPQNTPVVMTTLMKKAWDAEPGKRPEFWEMKNELKYDPVPYDEKNIDQSVKGLLTVLDSMSGHTRSDSCLVVNPRRYSPYAETTRSDRAEIYKSPPSARIFNNTIADGDETFVKKPVFVPTESQSANYFATISHQRDANLFEDETISSSQINTDDIRISSDDVEVSRHADDDHPLVPNEAINVTTKPSRKKCIVGLLVTMVILVGIVAALVPFCINKGCFVTCDKLMTSSHQTILCDNSFNATVGKAPSGSVCNVKCCEGFGIRTGSSRLICQPNGSWSAEIPTCTKLGTCKNLSLPANGGSVRCTNDWYEMSVCNYACPDGSHLQLPVTYNRNVLPQDGANTYNSTCALNSKGAVQWSNQEPYCEIEKKCSALVPTLGGTFTCKTPPSSTSLAYTNGTICELKCKSPFEVKGSSKVICDDDGSWNESTCQLACPMFEPGFQRTYNCTHSRFINSVCTFTCNDNFVTVGATKTTCHTGGRWTNKPPDCICPACNTGDKCDQSRVWEDVVAAMNVSIPNNFKYGDHVINCRGKTSSIVTKQMKRLKRDAGNATLHYDDTLRNNNETWSCVCRAIPSNHMKQCNGFPDVFSACKNTLSTFIKMMTYLNLYPLPCDAKNMPETCV